MGEGNSPGYLWVLWTATEEHSTECRSLSGYLQRAKRARAGEYLFGLG